MTRLRIMSDLHLEFGDLDLEPIGEDVLVLAGDVGTYIDGAAWAIEYARRWKIPVVMIAGNHEFYRSRKNPDHTMRSTLTALRALDRTEVLFNFLDDDLLTIAGVRFVGSTLWTDFTLGEIDPAINALVARSLMNDYRVIVSDTKLFQPDDAMTRHLFSVAVLRELFMHQFREQRPTVVMTHHLPSARSIDESSLLRSLDPSFASDLEDLVAESGAALWVHGHTHASKDYRIGSTRVVCNPRGYHPDALNHDFDLNFIVEV